MKYESIEGKRGGFLHVSDEENERIKPLLNRYGFLDKFPQEDYQHGYPELVDVFMWMFPESIKVVSIKSDTFRLNDTIPKCEFCDKQAVKKVSIKMAPYWVCEEHTVEANRK